MENRIRNIKLFQKDMPPRKVNIDDEVMDKWTAILSDFDEMLKRAQESLLEIKKQLYK